MRHAQAAIWTLIALTTSIELALVLSDWGFWGPPRLRGTAYEYAGFWPGLLWGWRPNYAAQPYAMFLTYGFFHAGPLHLAVNMVTLWSLGRVVAERVGFVWLALIYGGALLGGGLAYGLLSQGAQPMVGASGALFGLAGACLAWLWAEQQQAGQGAWPVLRVVGFLVALNLVMLWWLDGHLAWQTHLGGFLAGWAAGTWAPMRKP